MSSTVEKMGNTVLLNQNKPSLVFSLLKTLAYVVARFTRTLMNVGSIRVFVKLHASSDKRFQFRLNEVTLGRIVENARDT